jgi:hypothetical protein
MAVSKGNQQAASSHSNISGVAPGASVETSVIMRQEAPDKLGQLRTLLEDDQEEKAITLMGQLDEAQAAKVLKGYQGLAVSAFDNEEMYRAMKALKGELKLELDWMFDEGTDWPQVRDVIRTATKGHEQVRKEMKAQFVSLCNNEEMAEAVDLLGGNLEFKLSWMKEEGTNWALVQAKLRNCTDDNQKKEIRNGWKDFFVDLCNNDEMGLAVQLLGGSLAWKLTWMKEEGVDWQRLVQVIAGCSDDNQKKDIREKEEWKQFFISLCNNEEMAQVVDGLGGDLKWRLGWMKEEGTNWQLVARQLRNCTDDNQKKALREDDGWRDFFVSICNNREMSEAVELLGGDLAFKLGWMKAEGADWPQLREKIALCSDENQKKTVRETMMAFFVESCNNAEMAEAVTLLGGDLEFKLEWLKEEGTSWPQVKAILSGCTEEAQKEKLRVEAWKSFFVDLCGNEEMAEAVDILGGDLKFKLDWMEAEGTSWELVKLKLIACTDETQKEAVRKDLKNFFVSLCGNVEMAEAVDLLGGDLVFKLEWMKEEGTEWQLVREKLTACTDENQRKDVLKNPEIMAFLTGLCSAEELKQAKNILAGKAAAGLDLATVQAGMSWEELKVQLLLLQDEAKKELKIHESRDWRDAFVSICNNEEMAQAVDILGGTLAWKLEWMKEEGTNWQMVKEKLRACTDDKQKEAVRDKSWRSFFVSSCNNLEMAEAVMLLGGDLSWKLDWMLEEGTEAEPVLSVVNAAPQPEKDKAAGDKDLSKRLLQELGDEATRVFEALGSATFTAAVLIDQGGADQMIQAVRVIATSANVAATVTGLRDLGKWSTLLEGCPKGSELTTLAKPHVDVIYKNGGCNLEERKKLIQIRYHIEISDKGVGKETAFAWTQAELDIVYEVLAQLPEGTVLDNDQIEKLHRVVSGIGTYYSGYKAIHLPGGGGYNTATATWPNAVFVENHFRGTVRHEMGHAIDELVSGKEWYMSDPNIDWDEFGSASDWLASMEALGGWGPVTDEAERKQIRKFIQNHFADPAVNAPIVAPADANHPFNKYPACPIIQVANQNQLEGSHNSFATMTAIGNRVFTRRPVYQMFYSYNEAARRPPTWISAYGLSAPEDWFAEQVREYFRSTPPGANSADFVKNWFKMKLP